MISSGQGSRQQMAEASRHEFGYEYGNNFISKLLSSQFWKINKCTM